MSESRSQTFSPSLSRPTSSLNGILRAYATPLAGSLMLVVAGSGAALFFHLADGPVKGLHEWLGLAAILALGLHLWRNGKALRHQLAQPRSQIVLGAGILASAMFLTISPAGPPGGNPDMLLMRAAEHSSLSSLAPVLGVTPERLIIRLDAEGIEASPEQSVEAIARGSHLSPHEVMTLLTDAQIGAAIAHPFREVR